VTADLLVPMRFSEPRELPPLFQFASNAISPLDCYDLGALSALPASKDEVIAAEAAAPDRGLQLEAIRSGRLDAGFVFNMPKSDPELELLPVAVQHIELAALKGHPLTKLKKLRLRDLTEAIFVWFPRRESPVLYDRLMHECFRGGLKSPRIVQEGLNEATILSLAATGLGVGWVLGTARWRCPKSVVIMSVVDLNLPLPLALAWRRDNASPLLASFIGEVQRLPDVRAVKNG
jgi:DNA-binding transcriptional LysR family regulator